MEINTHKQQMMSATSVAKNENAPVIQAIAPIKAIADTTQHTASTADLHKQLQAMPEIDGERIAAAKAEIQAGQIQLNSADIAKAMINFHRN
ncbi:flagellar biosynthesis anti-sigma factor FlgM [Yersinia rohdei]|uniref:Negative regulator of flagellin synthesis n=1 Tax=Yersinia rohdei TaxID=29485 RepID=A0A0U1HNY4_YERRO|nr:flagellar biosynthesis anti-sigma factor FlgM [Yersinia rohdei]AJJ10086.1 flagellar biosynthesis anti-sigma factor FlgM [Yersinia rohdei]EEQ01163.1 Flagellar regulatory protein [Yersinia rohdei ATCC 43380]MDN0096722.1 flagellar biosynthesis anti-sigma factor FlgM [Yersinia rohdei]CQI88260.1 flagellar regulatory protein [Yersinia rohdei]